MPYSVHFRCLGYQLFFYQGARCKADILRTWGKYCNLLLQASVDQKMSGQVLEQRDSNLCLSFASLGFEDVDIPTTPAENFEAARKIFLPGQKFYSEAKEFYSFEEHCVDFTEINQVSILWKEMQS